MPRHQNTNSLAIALSKFTDKSIHHLDWVDVHDAIEAGDIQRLDCILEAIDLNLPLVKYSHRLLHWAVAKNQLSVVQFLVTKFPLNINKRDSTGTTALLRAIGKGYTAIAAALLHAKANANAANKATLNPLFMAAQEGYTGIVNQLIASGAEINTSRDNGTTPLFIAAVYGHTAIVKILLDAGANANIRDSQGATALLIAARQGHTDIVQLLIQSGADVNARRPNGTTPLSAAARNQHINVMRVLLAAGADIANGKVLCSVAKNKWVAGTRLMVSRGLPNWMSSPEVANPASCYFEIAQFILQVQATLEVDKSHATAGIRLWCADRSLHFGVNPRDPIKYIVGPMVADPSFVESSKPTIN